MQTPSWHSLPFATSAAPSGRGSPFHSLGRKIFSDATWARFPDTHHILLTRLTDAINSLSHEPTAAWVQTPDPVVHFNSYVDFGLAAYAAKLHQLYKAIADAIEAQEYVIYAQCGRAILENVATLHYYANHDDFRAALDAWRTSSFTDPVLRKANETLDRFVRGNRFS